jgi:hypothetical protein
MNFFERRLKLAAFRNSLSGSTVTTIHHGSGKSSPRTVAARTAMSF